MLLDYILQVIKVICMFIFKIYLVIYLKLSVECTAEKIHLELYTSESERVSRSVVSSWLWYAL